MPDQVGNRNVGFLMTWLICTIINVKIPFLDEFFATLAFFHYENLPMLYSAIFHGCKKDNFQMKNYDVFLNFAQNIDCGYTLEPPP